MAKKNNLDKNSSREILFIIVIAVCIALLGSSVMMLNQYSSGLTEQAGIKASLYSAQMTTVLDKTITDYESKAAYAARLASDNETELSVVYFLSHIREDRKDSTALDPDFQDVLFAYYLKDGRVYTSLGVDCTDTSSDILTLSGSKQTAFTGLVYDEERNMSVVGFYAPVRNHAIMDGIILFYTASLLENFGEGVDTKTADFSALCSSDGVIISVANDEMDGIERNYNMMNAFQSVIDEKLTADEAGRMLRSGTEGTLKVSIGHTDYILSVNRVGGSVSNLRFVGIFPAEDLYSSGYEFVNTILGSLALFSLILLLFSLYFIISRRALNKKIFNLGSYNEALKCPTKIGFERDVQDILSRNKATQFAIVVTEITHYKYIYDHAGEASATHALMYLKVLFSKMLMDEETYGYHMDGKFLLLLHYRDKDTLMERLNRLYELSYRYSSPKNFNIILKFGIYEVEREANHPVNVMIDFAVDAKDAPQAISDTNRFRFYDDKIRQTYIDNAEIEVKMERAIQKGEFEVFYQPKYNMEKNRQDGCEALVRWFTVVNDERKEYCSPATFVPLFEVNGFVITLDHYVYVKVCEYIVDCVAKGRPLYPISVNVSRATAIQSDFVDFYAKIKKKYNIADGFIMLEFTESFAYENYDVLSGIIQRLHENGFKCSIDDFGSGYSSYNCLRVLPMDEIKLDRFFIAEGISRERDDSVIASVISVAKSIGMKVTQEGVETQEDMVRLKRLGCQVIQGFYYSRPLCEADYIEFSSNENYGRMAIAGL